MQCVTPGLGHRGGGHNPPPCSYRPRHAALAQHREREDFSLCAQPVLHTCRASESRIEQCSSQAPQHHETRGSLHHYYTHHERKAFFFISWLYYTCHLTTPQEKGFILLSHGFNCYTSLHTIRKRLHASSHGIILELHSLTTSLLSQVPKSEHSEILQYVSTRIPEHNSLM